MSASPDADDATSPDSGAGPTFEPDDATARAQVAAFRALHRVTRSVHGSLDLHETLDAITNGVTEVTIFSIAMVNLVRADGDVEIASVSSTVPDGGDDLVGRVEPAGMWHQAMAAAEPWGALRFVSHESDLAADGDNLCFIPDIEPTDDPDAWHPQDSLFAPLYSSTDQWLGNLGVDLPRGGRRPQPEQLEVLELFAAHAAIAIEHARMHAELQDHRDRLAHAASHDPLTGLANRAELMSRAARMADQSDNEIGVLVLDLDGFKALNDSAGHQAGDEVLVGVSRRMQGCIRASDVLARIGGDEFVVVISGHDVGAALPLLRARLHAAVTGRIRRRDEVPLNHAVGVSIGVALAHTPIDFETVLAWADADMYRAKRSQRRDRPA